MFSFKCFKLQICLQSFYIIMKDNKSRSKRNLMVINLIQTPAGYSVIQGTQLLNKPQNTTTAQPTPPPIQPITPTAPTLTNTNPQQASTATIIKQPLKMTIKRKYNNITENNLLFLKSPANFMTEDPHNQQISSFQYSSTNKQRLALATWFKFDTVHENQRNQVLGWLSQWGYALTDSNVVDLWLNKYRSHRNLIINIYQQGFANSNSYLSASTIRKHVCEDARWLMKIHILLTSWGLINYGKMNMDNENLLFSANLLKLNQHGKYDALNLDSAFYSKCPKSRNKSEQTQNFMALKRVTKNIRPYCDYCGIHCQIVWFQHTRVMDPKQITTIMKNVNSKNPPLSEKQYEIILCTKCYCNGNFPLLLTHHDFRKITINDQLQPGKKKKSRKNKRKDKKLKLKQKLMEEQEQYKQEVQQMEDQINKQKQVKEDQQNQLERQQANKNHKINNIQINGTKQHKQLPVVVSSTPGVEKSAGEIDKQATIDQMIEKIITSARKEKMWTFAQTILLLELVEKHGEDWDAIYEDMVKAGMCSDCSPEDLIFYFIKLPQMNVSSLIEQNSDQCFINQNKSAYKSDFVMKKVQRNFDNAVRLSKLMQQDMKMKSEQEHSNRNINWRMMISRFVNLHMRRIDLRIDGLEELGRKALLQHKRFEQATKQITPNQSQNMLKKS